MHKGITISLLALMLFSTNMAFAQNNTPATNNTSTTAQEITLPKTTQILAVSRTDLSSSSAKVGDYFCAMMVEDIKVGNEVIVPSKSIVCGNVLKVKKAARLSQNGVITLKIDKIQTPDGQNISLAGREVIGKVISPYAKTYKERAVERFPISIASSGTSIPLDRATNLNGGVIYAISQGVSIVTGAVEGYIDPDVGLTRGQTAFKRAFESSPIGPVNTTVTKGKEAQLNTGDGLVLNFDKPTIAKINDVYFAQAGRTPTVAIK